MYCFAPLGRTWPLVIGAAAAFSWMIGSAQASAQGMDPGTKEEVIADIRRAGDDVLDCIRRMIEEAGAPHSTDPHREKFAEIESIGLQTRLTIYEDTAKRYRRILDGGEEGSEKFCREDLFPRLREAFIKAYPEWKKASGGVLAKVGLLDISHVAPFIAFFHNNFGEHIYGHSDITEKAIKALEKTFLEEKNIEISVDSIWLMKSAAQAVDFYGWSEESYHAHTPDHGCCDLTLRTIMIDEGKKEFNALFRRHWAAAISESEPTVAAFHIGILCHMIQDLIYHRGITLLQHAGLSYYLEKDPDRPKGSDDFPNFKPDSPAGKIFAKAQEVSEKLIRTLLEAMDEWRQRRMLTWTGRNEPGFKFDILAGKAFEVGLQKKTSLNELAVSVSMIRYYASSWVYGFGIRNPDIELAEGEDFGLIRWPVEDLTNSLIK